MNPIFLLKRPPLLPPTLSTTEEQEKKRISLFLSALACQHTHVTHTHTLKNQNSIMQLIPFFLFTIICSYSLVISAPVSQTPPDTQETKHQKATAIANRLLKELAGEHVASNHQEQISNKDENKDESKDTIKPVNHPGVEKVESHVTKQNDDLVGNDDEEGFDFIPTLDDLYEIYGDKYAQLADDEETSSEVNDDEYILPISTQQLMRYLDEQEESDEHLIPVIHTPVIDDSIMTAENHRQRRSIH